jgi:hypothetical protein
MQTVDLTPTWEAAVRIYIAVLRNPEASFEGVKAAEEELLRLANIVDSIRKEEAK